jgi:hypothetical protein
MGGLGSECLAGYQKEARAKLSLETSGGSRRFRHSPVSSTSLVSVCELRIYDSYAVELEHRAAPLKVIRL